MLGLSDLGKIGRNQKCIIKKPDSTFTIGKWGLHWLNKKDWWKAEGIVQFRLNIPNVL